MKVYLVLRDYDDEGHQVRNVWSTRELAEAEIARRTKETNDAEWQLTIDEYDVDVP